ncbi:kynureninase [Pseudomonas aeruginosa]|nr:kynureninase [Pseudomonas aeruginosa]
MNCRGSVGGDVRVPVAGSCARERWVLVGRPGNTGAVRAGGTQVTLCRTW